MDYTNIDWSWPSPEDPGGTWFGPLYDATTRQYVPQRPPKVPATSVVCLDLEVVNIEACTEWESALSKVTAQEGWKSTSWGRDSKDPSVVVMLSGQTCPHDVVLDYVAF